MSFRVYTQKCTRKKGILLTAATGSIHQLCIIAGEAALDRDYVMNILKTK